MDQQDIQHWKDVIDGFDHLACVRSLRFLPAGHPIFVEPELADHFKARLDHFGGVTPVVSKTIGWGFNVEYKDAAPFQDPNR